MTYHQLGMTKGERPLLRKQNKRNRWSSEDDFMVEAAALGIVILAASVFVHLVVEPESVRAQTQKAKRDQIERVHTVHELCNTLKGVRPVNVSEEDYAFMCKGI